MSITPPLEGTVLITGASSGIGVELARLLAPRAQRLVLVARRADRMHQLADELRATRSSLDVRVIPCDLGDVTQVEALIDAVRDLPVDVLINNAGLGYMGLVEEMEPARIDQVILVNILGLTRLTRGLLPSMLRRRRGGVLNVSSGAGLTWFPAAAVYGGAKTYVTTFSELLRLEVQPEGVVVTQVCPGPVSTEFEEVAGNPTSMDPPRFLFLDAATVARQALAAFEANKPLVIPGWGAWAVITLGRIAPGWLLRPLYAPLVRWLRAERRKAS